MRITSCASVLILMLQPAAASGPRVLFFVTSDCPVSNAYAPEIGRICAEYAREGVACSLAYEDLRIDDAAVRGHVEEYGYRAIPFTIDRDRSIAREAGATVTPEAVLFDREGRIRYRGRIDNRYAELGKPRRVVTERDLRDAIDAVLAGKPVARPETQALGCYIVPPDVLRKRP